MKQAGSAHLVRSLFSLILFDVKNLSEFPIYTSTRYLSTFVKFFLKRKLENFV